MFLPLKKITTFSFEIHKGESRAVPSPPPPNFRETCPITVILLTQKQTRVSQCVSVYVQNPDSSKKENKNTDRIVKLRGPSSNHTHTHTQILDPTKNRTFPFLNRPPALAIQTLSLSLTKTLFSFFFPIQYPRPPPSSSFSPVPYSSLSGSFPDHTTPFHYLSNSFIPPFPLFHY